MVKWTYCYSILNSKCYSFLIDPFIYVSIKTDLINFIMRVHQLLMRVARGSDYPAAPSIAL
jgi:hypothetical protein